MQYDGTIHVRDHKVRRVFALPIRKSIAAVLMSIRDEILYSYSFIENSILVKIFEGYIDKIWVNKEKHNFQ